MSARHRPTLRARLVGSYALVILIGAATVVLAVRLLDPYLLGRDLGRQGRGLGLGRAGANAIPHATLVSALNWSLLIGVGAALCVAALIATLAVRHILRPLDAVRAAARRLAAGHFDERVRPPSEPELAALAEDVNGLAAALAATERRRTRLIGDLAHELRTPVTTLRGMLEGALDGVIAPDGPMLASALEETGRLERLSGDLAALSRAEEGALSLRREPIDLATLADKAARRLAPQFEDKGVTLHVHAASAAVVDADAERLVQVVTNLLGNALRATPGEGVVEVAVRRAATGAVLTVRDSGIGLTSEDLAHVFERFWRGSNPGGPGTGIGLTIARAITEAHGGSLTATSSGPGHGACFSLELPLSSRAPGAP